MQNFIVIAVIILILVSAFSYIRKEKKNGVKCIGCPDAATCSGKCAGCGGNCGAHIYNESIGLSEADVEPETQWNEIPADFDCSPCWAGKKEFSAVSE